MDTISRQRRSWNMSKIKGKNTKPEQVVRSFLHSKGLRYRIHYKLSGRPDIVFPSKRIAVFVHGCFWHQHGCKNTTIPKTNTRFWKEKLSTNVNRDKNNIKKLSDQGWNALVIWECEIEDKRSKTLESLYKTIKSSNEDISN